jgi:hypothetical protein
MGIRIALSLVNEAIDGFQQQGMQYEIQKSRAIQAEILKAQAITSG